MIEVPPVNAAALVRILIMVGDHPTALIEPSCPTGTYVSANNGLGIFRYMWKTNFGARTALDCLTWMDHWCFLTLFICYSCVTGECDNNPATGACARIPYFSGPGEYNGQQRGGPNNNCGGEISKLKFDIANYRWAWPWWVSIHSAFSNLQYDGFLAGEHMQHSSMGSLYGKPI